LWALRKSPIWPFRPGRSRPECDGPVGFPDGCGRFPCPGQRCIWRSTPSIVRINRFSKRMGEETGRGNGGKAGRRVARGHSPWRLSRTGRAIAAEVNINPARPQSRRRRGVAVDAVAERFRGVGVKEFFIDTNLAGVGVETEGVEIMAVFGGGGQAKSGRPSRRAWSSPRKRDFGFPFDVLRLASSGGAGRGVWCRPRLDMAVTRRPAHFPASSPPARGRTPASVIRINAEKTLPLLIETGALP